MSKDSKRNGLFDGVLFHLEFGLDNEIKTNGEDSDFAHEIRAAIRVLEAAGKVEIIKRPLPRHAYVETYLDFDIPQGIEPQHLLRAIYEAKEGK